MTWLRGRFVANHENFSELGTPPFLTIFGKNKLLWRSTRISFGARKISGGPHGKFATCKTPAHFRLEKIKLFTSFLVTNLSSSALALIQECFVTILLVANWSTGANSKSSGPPVHNEPALQSLHYRVLQWQGVFEKRTFLVFSSSFCLFLWQFLVLMAAIAEQVDYIYLFERKREK